MTREMDAGFRKVLADTPVHRGYLGATAGYEKAAGLFARAEGGYHVSQDSAAFAFAEVSQLDGPMVGVGYKWEF